MHPNQRTFDDVLPEHRIMDRSIIYSFALVQSSGDLGSLYQATPASLWRTLAEVKEKVGVPCYYDESAWFAVSLLPMRVMWVYDPMATHEFCPVFERGTDTVIAVIFKSTEKYYEQHR